MVENISKLRDNMLKRKANKFAKMVDDNFAKEFKPPRLTLIITPGLEHWPKLTKEVLDRVEAPNNDWICLPLFVNTGDGLRVEFVLATKNTLDAWDKWETIIISQFENMKNNKLNPYQLGILHHMLNNSDHFKAGLEQLGGVVMPDKPQINNMRVIMQTTVQMKTKDKSNDNDQRRNTSNGVEANN